MKLTPLRAIKKHQPRLDVESRRVVWNVPDMTRLPDGQERSKYGNAKLQIAFFICTDKELIQKEMELELQKTSTQER
ncbi:MAG: hypothetical protein M1480_09790, partial [Bacteroidetes bacterium]|nr:hypothetical protein [Bacteroidota bacterium]